MNASTTPRILLSLLAAALLALAALPTRAAPAGGDYLAMQVPDLPRAVQFFHAVMNCAPVDAGVDASQTALLDCGNGHIVALTRGEAPERQHPPIAGTLATDDALAAATWLRANHVRIVKGPVRVAEGPGVARIVVTFLTPWGQPLQLTSHAPASALPVNAQLAVQ